MTMTTRKPARRRPPLTLGGVAGPLLFIAVFLIEGLTRPGYSPWRNLVSQLATGQDGWMQVANFLACGVLLLAFAVGLRQAIKGRRGSIGGPVLIGLFGVDLLVAGIFTTDPGLGYPVGAPEVHTTHGLIHGFSGLAAFVLIATSAFVMAWHFAAEPGGRSWAIYSAAIGLLIPIFFIASTVASNSWSRAPGGLSFSGSRSSAAGRGSPRPPGTSRSSARPGRLPCADPSDPG